MTKNLVILCGGDSSRMGTKKALLPFQDKTMLEYIYDKFSPYFDRIYLSVNERGEFSHLGLNVKEIPDIYRNAGPIGAILSSLTMISGDRAFFMSVDTPFMDPAIAAYLYDRSYNYDITTFKFEPDNYDTICAVFNKRCIGQIARSLFFKSATRQNLIYKCYTLELPLEDIENNSPISKEQQFYKINDRQSYYFAIFSLLKHNFIC
ncbi:MAG: molybdenum cofactor guanylyltransferase [Pseudobutyrivibrio sp.]|nr:molybdenum cofactor guanylyltransferase [Pseudobutyrivibrio sp.]